MILFVFLIGQLIDFSGWMIRQHRSLFSLNQPFHLSTTTTLIVTETILLLRMKHIRKQPFCTLRHPFHGSKIHK